jgi:hypothetical protein
MLDDMDLAVSKVECLSMGMNGRGESSLGKIQHCWESISLTSCWGGSHFINNN